MKLNQILNIEIVSEVRRCIWQMHKDMMIIYIKKGASYKQSNFRYLKMSLIFKYIIRLAQIKMQIDVHIYMIKRGRERESVIVH